MLGDAAAGIAPVEAGALDGLSREEVRAGAPRDGEMPLVSRLRSGEEVVIGEDFVEERMAALLTEIPAGDVAAILCTGPFRGIAERPGLVKAGPVFDETLRAATPPNATVGMLIPEPRQEEDARRPGAGWVPVRDRGGVAVFGRRGGGTAGWLFSRG